MCLPSFFTRKSVRIVPCSNGYFLCQSCKTDCNIIIPEECVHLLCVTCNEYMKENYKKDACFFCNE